MRRYTIERWVTERVANGGVVEIGAGEVRIAAGCGRVIVTSVEAIMVIVVVFFSFRVLRLVDYRLG